MVQGQDGSMTLIQPNLYRTTFENGQPVMVTLNPYSTQLVDNLNKMMGSEQEAIYNNTMNPQLAKLTSTLRKKIRCDLGHPGPCRQACVERQQQAMAGIHHPRAVNPEEVVFQGQPSWPCPNTVRVVMIQPLQVTCRTSVTSVMMTRVGQPVRCLASLPADSQSLDH